MNNTKTFILAIIAITVVASCSKTKKLAKGITGKWNISYFDYQKKVNGTTAMGSFTTTDKGTIELLKERTGSASIPVTQTLTQNLSITNWYNDAENVSFFFNTDKDTNLVYYFEVNNDIEDTSVWSFHKRYFDNFQFANVEENLKMKLYKAN